MYMKLGVHLHTNINISVCINSSPYVARKAFSPSGHAGDPDKLWMRSSSWAEVLVLAFLTAIGSQGWLLATETVAVNQIRTDTEKLLFLFHAMVYVYKSVH